MCVPLVTSLAATILGAIALRRIRLAAGRLSGRRLALAGTLLGSIGVVVWLGGLSWLGNWYRGVLNEAMSQRVTTFLELAADQPAEAAAEFHWGKNRGSSAISADEAGRFGGEVRSRFGQLHEFSIISEASTGTAFAPELEIAATFRFERGERLGAATFAVVPGSNPFIPRVRLRSLRIEDTELGDLLIPADQAAAPDSPEGG
jgi:hypothetical protein